MQLCIERRNNRKCDTPICTIPQSHCKVEFNCNSLKKCWTEKKTVKERKRTKAYTPEKVSVKYNNIQSLGSNNLVGLQSRSSTTSLTFQPQPTSRFSNTAFNTCFQPNLLLNDQRSSAQPFALFFRDSTYDELLTPAVSDNAYQIPPTAPQSTSPFNRCSVPQV